MEKEILLKEISDADADIEKYAVLAVKNEEIRTELVSQMITNRYIMVYYHCYYILDKASSRNPELFYKDWKKFEKLLDHENSYHRTIGLVMLSNLIPADKEKLFDKISDRSNIYNVRYRNRFLFQHLLYESFHSNHPVGHD